MIVLGHLAADRLSNYWRTLAANWFFIRMARAATRRGSRGLYCRRRSADLRYDVWTGADDSDRPAADGSGRLVLPDGDVAFDLDWGRADMNKTWLRWRVMARLRYLVDQPERWLRHVMYVARTDLGESRVVRAVKRCSGWTFSDQHRSWVTTTERLNRDGPLGRIWRYAPTRYREPDGWWRPDPDQLLRLDEFPKAEPIEADARGCIGRPACWASYRRKLARADL
jgi:hypothetical protein